MTSSDCVICCETFNLSKRKMITCNNPECEIEVCKNCVRTYLLGTSNDPHCLKCKTAWNQDFIVENLNRSFCKTDYKTHRTNVLVEREMSKMPESMAAAEKQKTIDGIKEEITDTDKELTALLKRMNRLKERKTKMLTNIWRLETGKIKMTKKKFIMPCSVENCRGFLSNAYKCELCEIYTCPDCLVPIGDKRTNEEHVCDEKTKENAVFIKETCKACPGMCGEFIFKIDGCDQMWCTTCHTAFSWRTGEIEQGVVHNPHYYAALQNGGGLVPRAPGDVVCGGLPDYYHEIDRPFKKIMRRIQYTNAINIFIPKLGDGDNAIEMLYHGMTGHFDDTEDEIYDSLVTDRDEENYLRSQINKLNEYLTCCLKIEIIYKEMINIHRQLNHITVVTIHDERQKIENYRDNENIRVDYLLNKINKEKLAELVYRADIKRQKAQEELYIWELLSSCAIDLFRDIAMKLANFESEYQRDKLDPSYEMIDKMIELVNYMDTKIMEYKNLFNYCNVEFKKIGITYGLVVPFIQLSEYSILDIKDRSILRNRVMNETHRVSEIPFPQIPQLYLNMLHYLNKVLIKSEDISEYKVYNSYNRMILTTEKWSSKQKNISLENTSGIKYSIRKPLVVLNNTSN